MAAIGLGLFCVAAAARDVGAQTQAECEDGIASIREALTRSIDADQRSELARALREAERELSEGEYDECLEAVEDAKTIMAGQEQATRRLREPDEQLQADPGLPVTVEDAFVPRPGEVEPKLAFSYDRGRRRAREDDDGPGHSGRDLYTPMVEIEIGVVPGLSAVLAAEYRFGDVEETKSGDVEVGGKWNFLAARPWLPALSLGAEVSLPYGYQNNTVETSLVLFGSMPLGDSADVPYLHANFIWTHASNRDEDDRANRYAGVLAVAVPVASSTALIVDVVREQEEEKGRINNLAELGIRHVLPGELVLAAGAGAGFGNSETDFRLLLGLQKTF